VRCPRSKNHKNKKERTNARQKISCMPAGKKKKCFRQGVYLTNWKALKNSGRVQWQGARGSALQAMRRSEASLMRKLSASMTDHSRKDRQGLCGRRQTANGATPFLLDCLPSKSIPVTRRSTNATEEQEALQWCRYASWCSAEFEGRRMQYKDGRQHSGTTTRPTYPITLGH